MTRPNPTPSANARRGRPAIRRLAASLLALLPGALAIVAGTARLEAAQRFMRFANRLTSIGKVAKHISYSPTRRFAARLVGDRLATGVDMVPHLPTAPGNMKRARQGDWRWWSDNRDEMNERFSAWLAL